MRNFQDIFETSKQSFISAFSICMTLPLNALHETTIRLAIVLFHRDILTSTVSDG